jgi:PAS domain S-box-containing protein
MSANKAVALNPSKDLMARLAAGEAHIAELESRLAEAEETLRAIRTGEIDALVVSGPDGDRVFSLEGADHAYRMLVEEMQEGTVTLDPEGLILYSNRRFASMMRTPVETLVGSCFKAFLPPERQTFFSELLADGASPRRQCELTLVAADGTPIPVQVSLNQLETGGIQTQCVVIRDLTEQRNYESIVKDGEFARSILDQTAEVIIVIDAHGKILRASECAHQLAGRNITLQAFDTAFELRGPEDRVNASKLLSAALEGQGLRGVEVRLVAGAKAPSTLLLSAGPLWSDPHELVGCVVTLTDITDRKTTEEALAHQTQALERSNSDLRQFAYAASHDLREPIRTVAVYSELFENKYKDTLDKQGGEFILHMVQAARRLEALMDDLLAYTQISEFEDAEPSLLDANEILAKTLPIFETAVTERGAKIESDPLPRLRVDGVHLQQLFQNLIGNGLKYSSDAAPRIRVSAQLEEDMWRLAVADNGIGIDPQYHKQIFGLFKRLHGGNKYAGSGMGLAICHKIVERYGGRMWVESEVGKGSTFFLTLPGAER